MLKRRTILQGTAPANHNYRFELEFENEELRQKWIASAAHQRVWPPVERDHDHAQGLPGRSLRRGLTCEANGALRNEE